MDARSHISDLPAGLAKPPLVPVALLAFVWIGSLLLGGSEFDQHVVRSVHVSERPWVLLVIFVTRLGDWEVLLALPFFASAWLMMRRRYRLAVLVLGSAVIGRLLVALQKVVLGRLRPDEFDHMVTVESFAFPSGHAANSMIVFLLLALLVVPTRMRAWATGAAILLSLLIGITRVLLGVHWPTDVLGGWAFGLLWVLLSLRVAVRQRAPNAG